MNQLPQPLVRFVAPILARGTRVAWRKRIGTVIADNVPSSWGTIDSVSIRFDSAVSGRYADVLTRDLVIL